MIRRWLALTYYLYALRLAALYHFYFNPLYNRRSKNQKAACTFIARVQAALHKARNSFIMPTRFHHRTAL